MIMNYFCDTFLKEKIYILFNTFGKHKKNFTSSISVVAAENTIILKLLLN